MRIELTKLILGGTRITYQATGDAVLEDRKRYTFAMGLLIVELSVQLFTHTDRKRYTYTTGSIDSHRIKRTMFCPQRKKTVYLHHGIG